MIRSEASGRRRAWPARSRLPRPSSSSQWRKGSSGVSVSRRFCRMSRSGISDGSWYTEMSPPRRASAGDWTGARLARARRSCRRPALTAPVRILTSVLLPAPLAPISAWISPGRTASEAERRATTAPYVFETPRRLEQKVGRGEGHALRGIQAEGDGMAVALPGWTGSEGYAPLQPEGTVLGS